MEEEGRDKEGTHKRQSLPAQKQHLSFIINELEEGEDFEDEIERELKNIGREKGHKDNNLANNNYTKHYSGDIKLHKHSSTFHKQQQNKIMR